ncbi:MAG: glycosyltransferase [Clostridia bacterium]|nr:glycosyltransferase [Clostridia bacterium]
MKDNTVLQSKNKDKKAGKTVKICIVTTFASNFEFFVSDEARYFAKNGYEVTVVCSKISNRFRKEHEKFSKVYELPMPYGISVRSLGKSVKFLNELVEKEQFDAIQFATPYASLCCALASKVKDIPVRVYSQWLLRYKSCKGLKRSIYKKVEKLICDRATNVVSASPKSMEIAIKEKICPKEKISVIGKGGVSGVDFEVFDVKQKSVLREEGRRNLKIAKDDFVFLYIGRLIPDEGVDELISAFRKICEKENNTKLVLSGMEDNPTKLRKDMIDWAKGSQNVIFVGEKTKKETAALMAASDILVVPTHRQRASISLTEAMAMELPVIVSDVPCIGEFVLNGVSGSVVREGDADMLCGEMLALMKDESRCRFYAKNGRERAEKFFAQTVLRKMWLTYYSRLIGFDDGHIKFMYLTSNPDAAIEAEDAGIDRIFLDLEIMGKYDRQGHLDTVVSQSSLDDVSKLRAVISKSKLLVRCNPVHPGLSTEIDRIIADGADIIMLPYFRTAAEAKHFLDCVAGRIRTVLLFETAESVENVDEILALDGIDEVYIGLNDLHLSYGMDFMFELLSNGLVEMLSEKFKARGVPYGFGGIAKIGEGLVKSDDVIGEHVRLGSTCAILSRTFRNEVDASRPIDDIRGEIMLLRRREIETRKWNKREFDENQQRIKDGVEAVLTLKKAKKTEAQP